MSEAFAAVIEFLFDRVGVNRICARHSVANPASGMVMQKCGLQKEGLCRQSFRSSDGQLHDMALYALLREDFIRDSKDVYKRQLQRPCIRPLKSQTSA